MTTLNNLQGLSDKEVKVLLWQNAVESMNTRGNTQKYDLENVYPLIRHLYSKELVQLKLANEAEKAVQENVGTAIHGSLVAGSYSNVEEGAQQAYTNFEHALKRFIGKQAKPVFSVKLHCPTTTDEYATDRTSVLLLAGTNGIYMEQWKFRVCESAHGSVANFKDVTEYLAGQATSADLLKRLSK